MDAASPAVAELASDHGRIGFGFTGVWGADGSIPSLAGNTTRERAEVWFEKE